MSGSCSLIRVVEGCPDRFSKKIGSRNSWEIDVFWSRISNPDEELYELMVSTGLCNSCPTLAKPISDQSDFLSLLLARGQFEVT